MVATIVECVPNISEGIDSEKIDLIVQAARNVSGCAVLGVEPDSDYNRTVITLAGEPEPVSEGAFQLIKAATIHIDMREHKGEHPRLGAVDVCPFVPLQGITMEECSELAKQLAVRVAKECEVPTFLYGFAATHEDRTLLSSLRKEQYEGFEARMNGGDTSHSETTRLPDFGPMVWNDKCASSGGITIGARTILVAYNVNIDETDAVVAKKIGSLVRSTGRLLKQEDGRRTRIPGMLPMVQGMGVTLESHGISQVSMNLRDVTACPMHIAFEACKSIAADHQTNVPGSELVGLVPLSAMLDSGRWYASEGVVDERELVLAAIEGLGLSQLAPFEPTDRIIEWAVAGAVE
ncbi:MAG: glutamate formimidoyltransferase [Candidatus Poseidoniaceae archaeon]|nr:glutamate formimidoyltransferase [Candidatus Poseidoniaceae archaeon]